MFALLVGVFVVAGNDVYAQDGGALGSGGGRSVMGSGAGRDGGYLGSGNRDGIIGSGMGKDGGMLGSGTRTDGASGEDDGGGGTIGSGTRTGLVGSTGGKSSFFDMMLRFFGF